MKQIELQADYLIAGAGAVGMAFADTILSETDANIIIVDRRAKAGGHWTDSYPFVTLHQPSAFYGVSSTELSKGRLDEVGLNKGLHDLASGAEICAYFDDVMRHTFLASGRVRFFPMCEYLGNGTFKSLVTGQEYSVSARKVVDATWLNTSIPATHTPTFVISNGANFIPVNDLIKIDQPPKEFVVIGGGKTAMDACLWLLEMGVDPDLIRWIMPRDGWLLDRENTQSSEEFFHQTMGSQVTQFEAIAASTSIDDMFDRLEAGGYFLRLDSKVRPSMFHAATVSRAELAELQRIRNVVRLGRVTSIENNRIVLESGEIPISPETLLVDCSASAIPNLEMKPIFQGDLITPQTVRSYQPIFSAAFIAHVEAAYRDESEKNRLCRVVPLPNHDTDFVRFTAAFMMNQFNWGQDPELRAWLRGNRLDGFSKLLSGVRDDPEKAALMDRMKMASMSAMSRLQDYLAELDGKT